MAAVFFFSEAEDPFKQAHTRGCEKKMNGKHKMSKLMVMQYQMGVQLCKRTLYVEKVMHL